MKRIAMFVASALLILTLIAGITHAAIVVSNDSWNQRTIIWSVDSNAAIPMSGIAGQWGTQNVPTVDRQGRFLVSVAPVGENVETWSFVVVSSDHVERLSPRQAFRRLERMAGLQLDNLEPLPAGATVDQQNARAALIAEMQAENAVARAQVRARTNQSNIGGVNTFFSIYVWPIALLSIAIAVFALYKSGKEKKA